MSIRPTCGAQLCDRHLPPSEITDRLSNRFGLCLHCQKTVVSKGVPRGGFIPSPAVTGIARQVLKRTSPLPQEIAEAERYARGKEYPRGPWDDRPAYRMAVLKYRKRHTRMHHLILGRRKAPSALAISQAAVHYMLVKNVMGLGHRYVIYCAGATFFGRQGLCPPTGRKHEVALGDSRYSKWKLSYSDYAMLGGHALRAAQKLGIQAKMDTDLKAFVTVAYRKGLEEGGYHPPVAVPHHSMRTDFLGDGPFDHKLKPASPEVPLRFHNKIRRGSGLIDGQWPYGIETRRPPPKPEPKKHIPTPSTDWLWG